MKIENKHTRIVSAYPCLGKTTITKSNQEKFFDREFNESRSTKNMTDEDKAIFFDLCARIIELQYRANTHEVLFISEDDAILKRLIEKDIRLDIVLPNAFDDNVMKEYRDRVIRRSGEDWYDRVIKPELSDLKSRIEFYANHNLSNVYLTQENEYISDVIKLA